MEGSGGDSKSPFHIPITYHDALHGFRAGRGNRTDTLEAKLLQQLAAMWEEVLYMRGKERGNRGKRGQRPGRDTRGGGELGEGS